MKRTMTLASLIPRAELKDKAAGMAAGLKDLEISDLTSDSREVAPGSLFLAVQGHAADGHTFIAQAFEKGAAAVAAQMIPDALSAADREKILLVEDSRKTTALAAARFYGHPSRDLTLVGVTGTNGKTTITWLLESIFTACGFKTGVIGTVNIRFAGQSQNSSVTTPGPVLLQKTLRQMKDAGITHVIMEVSSHSLDQYRVEGCEFNTCIYTNLSQDHLDYHRDLESYFSCKKRLFTDFIGPDSPHPQAPAIINVDDRYGRKLADQLKASVKNSGRNPVKGPVLRVSASREAEVRARDISDDIKGLSFTLDYRGEPISISSGLTGDFNLENILCAAGAAFGLGLAPEAIARGIHSLNRVPGRLEKLPVPLNRHIFVDYAHTPGALESILRVLSKRVPARLITVFGCGGDRDTTKRGPMGLAACRYSDIAIVTSDNPRTENPDTIVQDIVTGLEAAGIPRLDRDNFRPDDRGYLVEVDREKALNLALDISFAGDTIVAAGKGHETYQITNAGTIHFDDAEKLTQACQRLLTPMPWSVDDLSHALETQLDTQLDTEPQIAAAGNETLFSAIGTDSRTISPDEVFLALEGESFDGHTFIPDLVSRGIRAFVVRKGFLAGLDSAAKNRMAGAGAIFFETPDTLAALGKLAAFHRNRSGAKVMAITGSNGKTTTRKMAQGIFSTVFDTLATRGNFNNEIGLPQTLLRLAPVHQWAVVEMGMNHPGEISRLSAIARPDIAMITNTTGAHLEGLGTADNVAHAKSEIFESVSKGGTAIIFADDPRRQIMENHARANTNIARVLTFGTADGAGFKADDIQVTAEGLAFTIRENEIRETNEAFPVCIHTPARFMAVNALAAAAAARTAGISVANIQSGLASFTPVQGRMNLTTLSFGVNLIDDTYNANPASMAQALKTLAGVSGTAKAFAALGDMLELGPDSDRLHREIGHLAAATNPDKLYLFGTQTAQIMAGALEKGYPEFRIFRGTKAEIVRDLAQTLVNHPISKTAPQPPWLLLKGSRGMSMETIITELETLYRNLTEKKA